MRTLARRARSPAVRHATFGTRRGASHVIRDSLTLNYYVIER
jgi:hypothetical protein